MEKEKDESSTNQNMAQVSVEASLTWLTLSRHGRMDRENSRCLENIVRIVIDSRRRRSRRR